MMVRPSATRWTRRVAVGAALFACCLLPAVPGAVGQGAKGKKDKVSALDVEDYKKTFLAEEDLPGMRRTQDSRTRGADRGDKKYRELGGLHSGLAVWVAADKAKAPAERVVDIRWVFPDARAAAAYLKDQLKAMSEQMPPVPKAPRVGDETHLFGGVQKNLLAPDLQFRSYILVFRRGNVVIKFFTFHSDVNSKLAPQTLAPFGKRISDRVDAVAR
jgi:hypothetical protein